MIPATDPGDSFEDQCWGLLRRRYSPTDLVYLPAQMGGDCGVEGFSVDGIAYQCYADRDSVSLRHRTDKQKNKLYDDTEKLKKYQKRLCSLLGAVKVKHYFLMVPQYHAVELVEYAQKRADVVVAYKLPFISDGFAIRIKTPADYPAELRAALKDDAARAVIEEPKIDETHVDLFQEDKSALVQNLDSKLGVLKKESPSSDTVLLRNRLIRAFLAKEQAMESLREWPDTWESVERRRRLRQDRLEIENELDPTPSNRRLMTLIREYGEDLQNNVGGIGPADAQRLSMGQAGEWLLRCPLKFRSFE